MIHIKVIGENQRQNRQDSSKRADSQHQSERFIQQARYFISEKRNITIPGRQPYLRDPEH